MLCRSLREAVDDGGGGRHHWPMQMPRRQRAPRPFHCFAEGAMSASTLEARKGAGILPRPARSAVVSDLEAALLAARCAEWLLLPREHVDAARKQASAASALAGEVGERQLHPLQPLLPVRVSRLVGRFEECPDRRIAVAGRASLLHDLAEGVNGPGDVAARTGFSVFWTVRCR